MGNRYTSKGCYPNQGRYLLSDELDRPVADKIADRNSWLRIFVVSSITIMLCYKLTTTDFSRAMEGFDFSDLLSLFLAMFSIALAVLFYLKATDTSNTFYDNTYRFTRDVSEVLGRVEAGFGEKLKHLDEGYSGLKSAVERIPFDTQKAELEIQEEQEQLERVEKERIELIENLATRAQLEEKEKTKLFEQLQEQDRELTLMRRELHVLRQRLMLERQDEISVNDISPRLRNTLLRDIITKFKSGILETAPSRVIERHFYEIVRGLPAGRIHMLSEAGIIDPKRELTPYGLNILKILSSPRRE